MYSTPTKDPLPWHLVAEALAKPLFSPSDLLAVGFNSGVILDAGVGASPGFRRPGQGQEPSDTSTSSQEKRMVWESSCLDVLKAKLLQEHPGVFASLKEHCGLQPEPNMLRITSQVQSQKSNPCVLSGVKDTEISGEETSCILQKSLKANVADSIQRTKIFCAGGMDIQALDDSSLSKRGHDVRKRKVSAQDAQFPSLLGISSTPASSTAPLQRDSSKSTKRMLKQKVAAVESEELTLLDTDWRTDSNFQKAHPSGIVISQAETTGILSNPQGANLEDIDQAIRQEVDILSSRGTGDQELPHNPSSNLYRTKKEKVCSNLHLPKQHSSTTFHANTTILLDDSPRKEKSMLVQNATDANKKSYPTSHLVEAGDDHVQLGVDTSNLGHDLPANGCSRNMNPESLVVNRMTNGNLTSSDLEIVGGIFASEKQKLLSCQVDKNVKRDICMKCNKGGGLLNCRCGMTIHENCLGLPVEIKNSGTFICPVCLHFSAVIALGKALDTVSQTSGALRTFLSFGFLSQQEQPAPDSLVSSREIDVSHQQMESQAAIEKINSPRLEIPSQISDQPHISSNQIKENFANNDPPNTEHEIHEEVISVNECEDKELAPEMSGERQLDGLVDSRVVQKENYNMTNDNMATQHLEAESVHDLHHKGITHKKSKHVNLDVYTTNQNLRISLNTCQTRTGHQANHQGETSTYNDDAKNKDIVQKQLAKKNKIKVGSDKICTGSSTRSSLQRREKSQSHDKVVPARLYKTLGRRNKLAWSDEEVQALEELVISFASGNCKNMPWRKILEAGSNRFHKTRQPVDLKDKWRNMKKTEKGSWDNVLTSF